MEKTQCRVLTTEVSDLRRSLSTEDSGRTPEGLKWSSGLQANERALVGMNVKRVPATFFGWVGKGLGGGLGQL